jgi:hypothetical protein
MNVLYVLPDTGWTGLGNNAVRDWDLSVRARGLLVILMSYPSGNNITIPKIATWTGEARKRGVPAEGREALQLAMRELESLGYVLHVKARNAQGQWQTTTFVSGDPAEIAQVAPSTTAPYSVSQYSADQSSADPWSASRYSSTYKTDDKTSHKTGDQEAGLQSSSALAAARAGQGASAQDRLRPDMQGWYDAANKLDDERLRRHLLAFERKRPQVYRDKRQRALAQLGREDPAILKSEDAVRAVDMLSFKYALQHYVDRMPDWLIKLPR